MQNKKVFIPIQAVSLSNLVALFLCILVLCKANMAQHDSAQGDHAAVSTSPGIVVEAVQKGSAGEKAGLQVGDILLSWKRVGADGKIESPFDLFVVETDQAPRSPVVLEGLRDEEKFTWQLGPDVWGLDSRPNFTQEPLDLYLSGQQLEKASKVVATKVKCLMQRQHAPDLFELSRPSSKSTMRSRHSSRILTSYSPITGTSGMRNSPTSGRTFGAPILHAGRTQTLLKIRYKGEERLVEPYSLKYQQRRDGVEREYFFAYKLSGGESAPGIKMFVPEHMQSAENTDTKFEPRHQIELSKAGEMPENRYLFDPNKPARSPRTGYGVRARRPRHLGPRYVFRCSVCGKRFIKQTYDASMNSHKGKNKYPCYGTYGIYVTTKY